MCLGLLVMLRVNRERKGIELEYPEWSSKRVVMCLIIEKPVCHDPLMEATKFMKVAIHPSERDKIEWRISPGFLMPNPPPGQYWVCNAKVDFLPTNIAENFPPKGK